MEVDLRKEAVRAPRCVFSTDWVKILGARYGPPMKSIVYLFLFGALTAVSAWSAGGQPGRWVRALVVNVDDGDTLIVSIDHTAAIVDLAGLSCPIEGQPRQDRARQFTRERVMNQWIRIVPEGETRLGHIVGWVYYGDHCLNQELIAHGLAKAGKAAGRVNLYPPVMTTKRSLIHL